MDEASRTSDALIEQLQELLPKIKAAFREIRDEGHVVFDKPDSEEFRSLIRDAGSQRDLVRFITEAEAEVDQMAELLDRKRRTDEESHLLLERARRLRERLERVG
jgi:hypothetical protein